MTLRKNMAVRVAVGFTLAFAIAMLVPIWRVALFRHHGEDAVWGGHSTSYWRGEIVKCLSGPPPDGNLDKTLVWLGLAEDHDDWAFRCRYPPLTIPGSPWIEPQPPYPDKLAVVLQLVEDGDPRIRAYAAGFLSEFGAWPEGVATATHLLDDPSADVRLQAVTALGRMGPRAREALPPLVERMGDTHEEYHIYAAEAIWRIDPRKEGPVPVLAWALRGDDVLHRQRAVGVLQEMGPDAKGAFTELCATSKDGDRIARMYALRTHGTFGKRSLPALVAGLSDSDACVRGHALEALAKLGPEAHDAVPAVLRLRHDPVEHVRETTATTLGQIAPKRFGPAPPGPSGNP